MLLKPELPVGVFRNIRNIHRILRAEPEFHLQVEVGIDSENGTLNGSGHY